MQNKETVESRRRLIAAARGEAPADLVLKNAHYLNVFTNEWEDGDIAIAEGKIAGVGGSYDGTEIVDANGKWIVPALIDAHIHLESTIVSPREFAKIALAHGTGTVVTDPHEISNVIGTDGIRYILQATEQLGLDVRVMLPSCVPATPFDENAGALTAAELDEFYAHPRVLGLAEMMDYVGAYSSDAVIRKITAAHAHGKLVDGHAPALTGRVLDGYIAAGIYSDHECDSYENALEKLRKGQYIMIREGTAARNLKALSPLLTPQYASRCMFATDDKHPNDLLERGHIDGMIRSCINMGIDPVLAIKTASYHAAQYFGLREKGAIAGGYDADLLMVDDLKKFTVERVWCGGVLRAENGTAMPLPKPEVDAALLEKAKNTMHAQPITEAMLDCGKKPVIGLIAGELLTTDCGEAEGIDRLADILKVVVVERHRNTGHIGIGYLKGYGLKKGAVATSIAHDSHNIIAVGATDAEICAAVNRLIAEKGGIYVVDGENVTGLPLEIGGLMTEQPLEAVNAKLEAAKSAAYALGVHPEIDPFMSLSFLSLPVIPALKILTNGVFDVTTFSYRG
ncbi:MAG: adenine deaminase [Oscillospiraceae bacterium]|nr:adenine deaminase [Oscillospiraceae bacterium]